MDGIDCAAAWQEVGGSKPTALDAWSYVQLLQRVGTAAFRNVYITPWCRNYAGVTVNTPGISPSHPTGDIVSNTLPPHTTMCQVYF